jgi:hypothetical protein
MDIYEDDVRPQLTSQIHCVRSIAGFADDFKAPIRFHELPDGVSHHIMIICGHDAGEITHSNPYIAGPRSQSGSGAFYHSGRTAQSFTV